MRIAVLGSVVLPVPPPGQGGTEWIAYYQARGLAKLGHQVLLFAAQGSAKGPNELVELGKGDTAVGSAAGDKLDFKLTESSRRLRLENVYLAQVCEKLIAYKDKYDLILNNMRGEAVFLPFAKALGKPFVNVMHLPLFKELAELFREYKTPIITISNAQRREFPDLNYLATVYNCVDTSRYVMLNSVQHPIETLKQVQGDKKSDYLLMVGSIGVHKNQKSAIVVAKKLGFKLVLAGKIRDNDYFKELKKDIDGEQIKWFGELDFDKKLVLYQGAKAFIFPILWEEPFGLVMIEAMACGTPIVAFANGAVSEVVVNGRTGYLVLPDNRKHITDNKKNKNGIIQKIGEEGLIEAITKITSLSDSEYIKMRQDCRKHVEENFSVDKMVKAYEKALLKLL